MKYFVYAVIGFIVFWVVEFLSVSVGSALGSGAYEIGLIGTAISLQSSILVICTLVIVDAIKGNNHRTK